MRRKSTWGGVRLMFLITILAPEMALAQLGARAPASTSVATQLPLSGRSANTGSAATTQTPIPGATTSVNTINTTVQVSGPLCRQLAELITPFSGKLSFKEAIQRGLEFNLGTTGRLRRCGRREDNRRCRAAICCRI